MLDKDVIVKNIVHSKDGQKPFYIIKEDADKSYLVDMKTLVEVGISSDKDVYGDSIIVDTNNLDNYYYCHISNLKLLRKCQKLRTVFEDYYLNII